MYLQYDPWGRPIMPTNQPNQYDRNNPMIDRDYYNRIRNNPIPDSDPRNVMPPSGYRSPVPPNNPYDPYTAPVNNAPILDYNGMPGAPSVSTGNFSIPDISASDAHTSQPEESILTPIQTLEEMIKSLKQKGYEPLPGSEKIPLYNESRFKSDIVVRGKQYEIILVSI